MFKKFKEDFFKKVRATENRQQPTMWNAVSSFEASKPSIFDQERIMYKRGGYMGGGTMVENMQTNMKKKMEKPRGGYAHGGYASIADMEKKCISKTKKNTKR